MSCKNSLRSQLRSQRRRELDARRSKSRVRLGSCLQRWGQLKEELGFSLHSEFAQHLLDSYISRTCIKCSGNEKRDVTGFLSTTKTSLQELILLVHNHGQKCPHPPGLQSETVTDRAEQDLSGHEARGAAAESKDSEINICLKYTCDGGHHFLWSPMERKSEKQEIKSKNARDDNTGDVVPGTLKKLRQRDRKQMKQPITVRQELVMTRKRQGGKFGVTLNEEERNETGSEVSADNKDAEVTVDETEQDVVVPQEGNDVADVFQLTDYKSPAEDGEMAVDDLDMDCGESQRPSESNDEAAVLNLTSRGTQRRISSDKHNTSKNAGAHQNNSPQTLKDDTSQIGGRKKRKITQKVILPCEFEGCDKIFSSRQYLNHHVKYQHLQRKTFSCSDPTCNKSFNFKKHLKEHEKLHSNQRDYICEFCARAFRTSSNLIIHRRIHTGEKPLQCEVCGFTCRQKASLNWHMRKHNAESTYQFPCEICGRRFEKRDNVTAHRSKSHPEHNTPTPKTHFSQSSPSDPVLHPAGPHRSSPDTSKNHSTLV